MSKFKVGEKVRVVEVPPYWEQYEKAKVGFELLVSDVDDAGCYYDDEQFGYCNDEYLELAEDRTNWHPHADVIIAWAKGEEIRGRNPQGGSSWYLFGRDSCDAPGFYLDWIWEIAPDNSEEIDRIKQEIQAHGKAIDELQAKLKELEA